MIFITLRGKATSVEIYDVVDLPGVYVRREPDVDVLNTSGGSFQVVALPYVSPSSLAAEGLTIEEMSLSIRSNLEQTISRLIEKLDPALPTVLMTHFSLIGAVSGSEQAIMLGREITLPVDFFARPELDYVALGHIHKHQVLCDDPPMVYCGSLDRVDFNEEKEEKGFVEVFLLKDNTSYEFVPLDTRPFITFHVDVGEGDPFSKVMESVEWGQLEDAIVKIKVRLPAHRLADLQERELYKLLRKEAFYVAGIEKDIISDLSHLRHPGITERMDIRRAIKEYITKKDEYKDMENALLKTNEQLILELGREGTL
jgi:exonuclease SbcD